MLSRYVLVRKSAERNFEFAFFVRRRQARFSNNEKAYFIVYVQSIDAELETFL